MLVFGPLCEKEVAILARRNARVQAFIDELRLEAHGVALRHLSVAVRLARVTPGEFSWRLRRRSGAAASTRIVRQAAGAAKELARGLLAPPKRGVLPEIESRLEDSQPVLAPVQLGELASSTGVQQAVRAYRQKPRSAVAGDWNQERVLKLLGYSVGASGETKVLRRRSLEARLMLEDHLIPAEQSDFGAVGGRAASCVRSGEGLASSSRLPKRGHPAIG
jgi:hypothetical protein